MGYETAIPCLPFPTGNVNDGVDKHLRLRVDVRVPGQLGRMQLSFPGDCRGSRAASLRLQIEMHAESRQYSRGSHPSPRMRGWDVAALEPPLVYPQGPLDSGNAGLNSELRFMITLQRASSCADGCEQEQCRRPQMLQLGTNARAVGTVLAQPLGPEART